MHDKSDKNVILCDSKTFMNQNWDDTGATLAYERAIRFYLQYMGSHL